MICAMMIHPTLKAFMKPSPTERNDEMLKMASQYVEHGLAVFPTSKTRTPCVKDFPNLEAQAITNPGGYKYGYGISLSASWLVLDYDPRRDEPGQNQLKSLWSRLGLGSTKTYIVRTGRGGCHVYFRKPAETLLVPDLRKLGYPAIELKSYGRYVIGPGSPHPEGNDYKVEKGSLDLVEDAPEALLEFCKRTTKATTNAADVFVDDEVAIKRFEKYCQTTPPGVQGDGSDLTVFSVACKGKVWGLSHDAVFDIMAEHYIDRCTPAGDLDFLKRKVDNAFSYSQDSAGSKHPYSDYGFPDAEAIEATIKEQAKTRFVWDQIPGKTAKLDNTLRNGLNFFQMETYGQMVWVDGYLIHDKTKPELPNPLYKLFSYDEFLQYPVFTRHAPWHNPQIPLAPISDSDALQLRLFFNVNRPFTPTKDLTYDLIDLAARDNPSNSVCDYLRSLKWDGIARLDRILPQYAGTADSAYTREVGKNTMIAAVARAFDPGCKHDSMLVLEGPQELGKSKFVSILGGQWSGTIKIDPSSHGVIRTVSAMRGKWFLEEPEMKTTRKSDAEELKAFLTIQTDVVRLAYGRSETVLPRRSIFIGTINPDDMGYLLDKTGNRRFWPVACSFIDMDGLEAARDQLFAEAVHRYDAGEKYHIVDAGLRALARGEQNARVDTDDWVEVIANWLAVNGDHDELTTDAICYGALNMMRPQLRRVDVSRLCRAIEGAGYERKSKRVDDTTVKVWIKSVNIDDFL